MSAENLKKWNEKNIYQYKWRISKDEKMDWKRWTEMHHPESGIISLQKTTHIFINCKKTSKHLSSITKT